jgi:hypothetical protein
MVAFTVTMTRNGVMNSASNYVVRTPETMLRVFEMEYVVAGLLDRTFPGDRVEFLLALKMRDVCDFARLLREFIASGIVLSGEHRTTIALMYPYLVPSSVDRRRIFRELYSAVVAVSKKSLYVEITDSYTADFAFAREAYLVEMKEEYDRVLANREMAESTVEQNLKRLFGRE